MEKKNIILIAIAVLVVILVIVAAAIYTGETAQIDIIETVNNTTSQTVIDADNVNTDTANDTTVVGDNSTRVNETGNGTNQTYQVYNPQSDSYVDVIGEAYDDGVNRWYTYDTDGVRYYNTRIN